MKIQATFTPTVSFSSKADHTPPMKKEQPSDTVSIGAQAKQLFQQNKSSMSLVEQLMKQRESILEMKQGITERAAEKGNTTDAQEQLKALEEQLAAIDAKIAEAQKKKQEKEEQRDNKPKSIDEVVISQSGSLQQAKTLQRIDRSLTREKASLEAEMELDAQRGFNSERKAERVTEIDEQKTFVQDQLTEVEEADQTGTGEVVTLQEKLEQQREEEREQEEPVEKSV